MPWGGKPLACRIRYYTFLAARKVRQAWAKAHANKTIFKWFY